MTEPSGSRFPDALVLICGLILAAQLATYVLPAGEFEREGRQVVRGTYHAVAAAPLPVFTFLTAVPAGLADAAGHHLLHSHRRRGVRGAPGDRGDRCADRPGDSPAG